MCLYWNVFLLSAVFLFSSDEELGFHRHKISGKNNSEKG